MENKNVGYLIIGIAVIMSIIILIYNVSLRKVVSATCSHGSSCSMYEPIKSQMWLSYAVILLVVLIGVVLIFNKQKENVVIKEVEKEVPKKEIDLDKLEKDERKAVEILQEEKGGMFQADLMEKLEIGKVGMTRLLDKLEAKQIIERKRRGMNNIVILRQ